MQPTQESAPQNVDLTSVLARLEEQDKLIAKLTSQVNPENKFTKAKDKYQ